MAGEPTQQNMFARAITRLFNLDQPQYLILLLGTVVLFGLGYGIFNSEGRFLYELRSTEVSRGLLTFLVAVTTVSIAILVALYAISSNLPADQIKERFGFAKEVLTTLVGILGTVLGFYFGSADKVGNQALQLAETKFQGTQVLTHISGGTPPYRYSISYPGQGENPKPVSISNISKDGWIIETLTPVPPKNETISLEITDSKDQRVTKTVQFVLETASDNKH